MSRYLAAIAALFTLFATSAATGMWTASADDGCRAEGQPVGLGPLHRAGYTAPEGDTGEEEETGSPRSAARKDWDVSAPFGPTRVISFDTDEGTWMSVDVHPSGRWLVFDMLGDLYRLPIEGGDAVRLTEGPAYDFQPRFSPDGKTLLFASDRGGETTLYKAGITDAMALEKISPAVDENLRLDGGMWDPSGQWLYARKRTTDVSSIGVAELWQYHVDGGKGLRISSLDDSGEVDFFNGSRDGRYVYFGASRPFNYGRNPFGTIWEIRRYDRRKDDTETIAAGSGSSACPLLSPDGTRLAFLRRVDRATTLWMHDLRTGGERRVWDGLDRDQLEGFATHGVYPLYAWMPDGKSLVVWAKGKLHQVDATDGSGRIIPFHASVAAVVHEPLRFPQQLDAADVTAKILRWPTVSPDGKSAVFQALGHLWITGLQGGTPRRLTSFAAFEFAPAFSPDGRTLAFTTWDDATGGALWKMSWPPGPKSAPVRVTASAAQMVNPSFSPDGRWIVYVQGSAISLRGGDLGWEPRLDVMRVPAAGGTPLLVTSTGNRGPGARMCRPSFSADGSRIHYSEEEEQQGGKRGERTPAAAVLCSIQPDGADRRVHVRFRYAQEVVVSPDDKWVSFTELHNAYIMPMPATGKTVDMNTDNPSVPFVQLSLDGGEWLTFTDHGRALTWGFADTLHRVRIADLEWSDKAATRPDAGPERIRVTLGDDGAYAFGGETRDLAGLKSALAAALANPPRPAVVIAVKARAPFEALDALHAWLAKEGVSFTDEAWKEQTEDRKPEPSPLPDMDRFTLRLRVPRAHPAGTVALVGGRVITMNGADVIDDGVVVATNGVIRAVGKRSDVAIPAGAHVVDVTGKTLMPGLVDVHAHLHYSVLDVNAQKDWRYFANLAFGVTTVHDPSASTHTVFGHAEMINAGMMTGPRVFSTGFILYGALSNDMAVVKSYEDALSHIRRLKSQGAISVKSYMQPRRDQRQWILKAARAEGMMVVPEGGGDLEANMGMILDGHTGIEHSLVVAPIYKDVQTLFAKSGVGYTPTLLVAYGGQKGENWFYQHDEVWKNARLQRFHPPGVIDERARRRSMSAEDDFNHMRVAEGCNQILGLGGLVNLGGHGQLQGLGAHWEMWAFTQGGMTNHDALRVATIDGARYLGLDGFVGSLAPGKFADILVLDMNPLEDIHNSQSVRYTMINGVLFDADSMDRLWPSPEKRKPFHYQMGGAVTAAGAGVSGQPAQE